MKRLIFMLMALVLVFTVFAANTMFVFAEGEDTSTGAEETLPEGGESEGAGEGENAGEGESGSETLPPESEGTGEGEGTENGEGAGEGENAGEGESGSETLPPESEGTEEGGEQLPPETEGTEEDKEELSASEELFALAGQLKDEIFGMIGDVFTFITSNETYKNIATAVLAVLAILIVPFLVALLVIAYVAMAAVITVAGALMSLAESIIAIAVGAMFII